MMMGPRIQSSTSYGKLNSVIVGRELELNNRNIDFTFKHMYQSNLNEEIYQQEYYQITDKIIKERIESLDKLAEVLTNEGVVVERPTIVDSVKRIQTPEFKGELSSASNVRDLTLVLDKKIIETPTYVTHRYFENNNLNEVFNRYYDYGMGGQWIKSPNSILTKETLDLEHWEAERNFRSFDKSKYTMAIDGAQFCRTGHGVIVNISTYNHYLGYLWVKSVCPYTKFFPVFQFVDNHIDGKLICLNENTFLIDSEESKIKLLRQLPDFFKKYEFIIPTKFRDIYKNDDNYPLLSSERGMDINILSINPNKLLVDSKSVGTIDALEKNGFEICTVDLKHSEVFAGGIHCSTLDLNRD